MKVMSKVALFLLAFVSFLYGLVDVIQQYKSGEEISWQIPMFCFSVGVFVPALIFYFADVPDYSDTSYSSDTSYDTSAGESGGSDGGGGD